MAASAGRTRLDARRWFTLCSRAPGRTRRRGRVAPYSLAGLEPGAVMAAVGARMEAVAPKRSLLGPDYLRLAVLAAVSVRGHLRPLGTTAVTARDSLGFARYALCLESPGAGAEPGTSHTAVDVVRESQQPPGYPVAVWAALHVVRKATDLPLPESSLLATQIASSFAALL